MRQPEDALKNTDRIGSTGTVDAVGNNGRDCRIVAGNPVNLLLNLLDLLTAGADAEIVAGPGSRNAGNARGGVNIHIIAVIITDNIDGAVTLIPEIFGTPLGETVAGCADTVTIRRKNRLTHAGAGQEVVKNTVYNKINIGIDISAVNPFLVIGGGGGNGEVVALVSVPRNHH